MKKACIVNIVATLACAASSFGAAVLADRVVVTNSVINTAAGTVATHWAEVQVFQQGSGTNVAAGFNGGTAIASSTGWGTSPSWAIDGNTNGDFGANSAWHDTDGQGGGAEPDVFTVTFSSPVTVDSFNVWGRTDCCPERDDTFLVEFFSGATLVGSNPVSIGATFNTGVAPIISTVPEPSLCMVLPAAGFLLMRRRRA